MTNDTKRFTVETIEAAAEAWAPVNAYLTAAADEAFKDYRAQLTRALDEAVAARVPGDSTDKTTLRAQLGYSLFYASHQFVIDPERHEIHSIDDDGDDGPTLSFREIANPELRRQRAYREVTEAEARRRANTQRVDLARRAKDLAELARLKELYPNE
jgi:hypothetical protein